MVAVLSQTTNLKRNCGKKRFMPQFPASLTLGEALASMKGDMPMDIPWIVRLVENPASPVPLPGKVDLYHHDCLHILLERDFSLYGEAFIVGFSMGNDPTTTPLHIDLVKWFSSRFYPQNYRFTPDQLKAFDLGVAYGRRVPVKNLNQFDFTVHEDKSLNLLQHHLGIDRQALQTLRQAEYLLTEGKRYVASMPWQVDGGAHHMARHADKFSNSEKDAAGMAAAQV